MSTASHLFKSHEIAHSAAAPVSTNIETPAIIFTTFDPDFSKLLTARNSSFATASLLARGLLFTISS